MRLRTPPSRISRRGRSKIAQTAVCLITLSTALSALPNRGLGQVIDFRFVAIDMYGGGVWPENFETGVAFGARVGFADAFGRWLRLGVELDWWTAQHEVHDLEARDAVAGLAVWRALFAGSPVRPYLGLAGALHSVDVSREDGGPVVNGAASAVGVQGVHLGGSLFVGIMARTSRTGAIWVVGEYRYSAVSKLANHELRVGFRLGGSGR